VTQLEHERPGSSYELRSLARNARPEVRNAAARAMGRIQSWDYLPDLIRLTSDPLVLREAVFAIGQLGWIDPPDPSSAETAIQALLRLEPNPDTLEALGKIGHRKPELVHDLLIRCSRHLEPALRAAAALALFRLYPKTRPESAASALIDMMADAIEPVRWRAVYPFSRLKEPSAMAALIQTSRDPSMWVRLFSVRALGKIEDAAGAPALVEATFDAEPMVRLEAIQGLIAIRSAGQVRAELLKDPSPFVRAAAVRARGEPLLEDPSATVRAASIALGKFPPGLRNDPDWRIRTAAAEATQDLPVLREMLQDPDERVQAAALKAIGRIKTDDAWKIVTESLGSTKLSVRGEAIELSKGRTPALGALIECYGHSLGREWIEAREALVDAIAAIKDPGVAEFLQSVLAKDPVPSVRAKAAVALGLPARALPAKIDRPDLLEARVPPETRVVLETDKGEIEVELFPLEAPVHVANFVQLVDKGHYDGLIFHRVVPNFVIQGGDPRGDGWGDAGYNIADEINPVHFDRGMLGMPKAGKDTGGCQIFITHVPTPHLDGRYTVFGRVIRGMDVVDRIEVGDRIIRARR
jgi:cyclophilin family peptidyl-prolyl cis-trans isomerase/HEAT repeat protein